jgi:hypothetical protein
MVSLSSFYPSKTFVLIAISLIRFPSVIDACILAMGSAFVGTDRSTYSLIAQRRVADWSGGPARLVKWGFIGADNH